MEDLRLFYFTQCRMYNDDLVNMVTGEVLIENPKLNPNIRIGWYTGNIIFHIGKLFLIRDTCEKQSVKNMKMHIVTRL